MTKNTPTKNATDWFVYAIKSGGWLATSIVTGQMVAPAIAQFKHLGYEDVFYRRLA